MNHEYEQNRATSPDVAAITSTYTYTVEPGQLSRSALLRKPEHAIMSGLVQRKVCDKCSTDMQPTDKHTLTEQLPDHDTPSIHQVADHGMSGIAGTLPHLEIIQRSFGSGHDLSGVRSYVGGPAAAAAAAMGALAYAKGDQVAFAGVPSLHTAAHEAAHVVQQRAGVYLKNGVGEVGDPFERNADEVADRVVRGVPAHDLLPVFVGGSAQVQHQSTTVQRQHRGARTETARCQMNAGDARVVQQDCPQRETGEREQSAGGRLQFGTLDSSSPIVYGFRIGSANVSTLNGASGWAPFWGSLVTQSNRWEIIGFSDCEGGAERNTELRLLRAMNVNNALPQQARANIVRFRDAPLAEYVAANDTAENRAYNRSVVFRLVESSYTFEDETVTGVPCPPPSGAAARSLSEYTALIACAERITGHTPRQMLAMLRQLYYGKPWSATSTTDRWDNVIPCSLNLGNPEGRLGANLYWALWSSAEVAGVDVGHVFTGLEAMICPSPTVTMAHGLAVIHTPNEDFATWAGDLGAAAASFVVCPQLGTAAASNEDCFGQTGAQPLAFYATNQAPRQDLEGDIDAFALRASSMGIPCTGSARRPLVLTRPISELFLDYYNVPDSPLGTAHENRYQCFLQAIGATLSGSRITNRFAITPSLVERVYSFAEAFYVKIWGGVISGGITHQADFGDRLNMRSASSRLVSWFLDELEGQL